MHRSYTDGRIRRICDAYFVGALLEILQRWEGVRRLAHRNYKRLARLPHNLSLAKLPAIYAIRSGARCRCCSYSVGCTLGWTGRKLQGRNISGEVGDRTCERKKKRDRERERGVLCAIRLDISSALRVFLSDDDDDGAFLQAIMIMSSIPRFYSWASSFSFSFDALRLLQYYWWSTLSRCRCRRPYLFLFFFVCITAITRSINRKSTACHDSVRLIFFCLKSGIESAIHKIRRSLQYFFSSIIQSLVPFQSTRVTLCSEQII